MKTSFETSLKGYSELRAQKFFANGEHYWDHKVSWWKRRQLLRRGFIKAGRVWYGPDCKRCDLGVLSRKVVTTVGVGFIVDAFQNLVELELMNFHASGTGATAEAVGDTALVTEVETRATGTQSEPAANQYRTVGTVSYTATRTIAEHGIFSASTAGTLFDRSLVSPTVGVNSGDSIQFTYTLTLTAGG